ncbi:MAG: RluA family pseudouridine synthase [Ktedonobacteraceae bacterium]|nr:RluA family pseudouridine synthase [Ktedonobacteraceae bacterium]
MQHTNAVTPEQTQVWHIQPEQAGERLDRWLVAKLETLSRTAVQQLIAGGEVLINGRPGKPGYLLRAGDEIRVLRVVQAVSPSIRPQALPLDIVYEDRDLVVVNKAAGMVVHPAPGHYEGTLINALAARYPELLAGEGDMRPGIVHRLDKDTSGLLIVARNRRAQAALIEAMKQHRIEKRYLALVEGVVALDQGGIDAPVGRDPRHRQKMAITATGSREARTYFRVVQRYARHTLLQLQLETGRTHQIRVHLAAIGHPVVGDQEYGSGRALHGMKLERQFLHAYQLRFTHPTTGKILEFEVPLPADLQAVLGQPDLL